MSHYNGKIFGLGVVTTLSLRGESSGEGIMVPRILMFHLRLLKDL